MNGNTLTRVKPCSPEKIYKEVKTQCICIWESSCLEKNRNLAPLKLTGNLLVILYQLKESSLQNKIDICKGPYFVSRENLSSGFPTRSDTNRGVHPQKMARG